uniref:CD99 molecule n=1 Tax=Paramormyrops kingsleyae TaxID=1676925 RepID=A0A3B3SF10_9TELE
MPSVKMMSPLHQNLPPSPPKKLPKVSVLFQSISSKSLITCKLNTLNMIELDYDIFFNLDELDLSDALGPADPKTEKPKIVRPNDGGTGGGTFGDDDLFDLSQNEGYKPDAGKGGQGGGRIADPSGGGGASQPQEKPGQIAGIVSAIGVALIGAASGYIAYQKKKLCFKMQGGDPERGVNTQRGNQSESNVLSNLLRIS